jgi:hypothetical protein
VKRREFLLAAAALTTVPKLSFAGFDPEPAARAAPYLALKKYLEPGTDEFTAEKSAADLVKTASCRRINRTSPVSQIHMPGQLSGSGNRLD